MSRSHDAQNPSFGKRIVSAAVGCMIALSAGCRFSTSPSEVLVDADAGGEPSAQVEKSARERAPEASTPAVATGTADAAAARDEAPASDAAIADRSSAATPDAGLAPSAAKAAGAAALPSRTPTTVAMPAAAGSAAPPASQSDAGAPHTAPDLDAGAADAQTWSDERCNAELTTCLLEAPLNYAECLRVNALHDCPEPDAGTATTSPVTGEDGKPISQACQAQLADCIMRNPTPDNANSCTEKARMCRL